MLCAVYLSAIVASAVLLTFIIPTVIMLSVIYVQCLYAQRFILNVTMFCFDIFYFLMLRNENSIQDLRLVGRGKCLQQINRENILSLGKQSLVGILIVSDYPPTSVINIFSNDQIYCPCHLSSSAMLCLSPSLFLCPSAILLSPHNFWFRT